MNLFDEMINAGSVTFKDEIEKTCEKLTNKFNVDHFSYAIIDRKNQDAYINLTNDADNQYKYFSSQMHLFDMLLLNAQKEKYDATSETVNIYSPYYKKLANNVLQNYYNEGLNIIGSVQGISIVYTTKSKYHIVSFFSKCNTLGYIDYLLGEIDELKLFANAFYTKFCSAFKELSQHAITYNENEAINSIKPILLKAGINPCFASLKQSIDTYKPNTYLETHHIGENNMSESINLINLSKRELECLLHYSQGKQAKEIANKLFISKRTVENNIYNARKKLNIKNNVSFYKLLANMRNLPLTFGCD